MKRKEPQPQKKKSWPYVYAHPKECYMCWATAEATEILPSGLCGKCFEKVWGALPGWMSYRCNGKKNGHKKG